MTKAGAARVRQAEAIAEQIHTEVLATLPAGERRALLDGLARLRRTRPSRPAAQSLLEYWGRAG